MPPVATASAFSEITRLAGDPRVHQAFRWLHLREQTVFGWQLDVVQVPAPPFGEEARARWLAEKFRELGLDEVDTDQAGNVLGILRGSGAGRRKVLLSAHLDTVFPAGTPITPVVDGQRLTAPGACDNGAGIAGMLALAAAILDSGFQPACDLVFLGNVGEEGDGNLRGMRQIYQHAPWREDIEAHLVLDGAGDHAAITHALGSQRFRASIAGPGGHSWTDAGAPNPILLLSQAITRLGALDLPDAPRTTFNVGTIDGGTSVNAIPERATASFDLRSTDPRQLIRLEVELHRAIEDAVIHANRDHAERRASNSRAAAGPVKFAIEKIGDRPAGSLPEHSRLLDLLYAVDRQLGLRTETRVASTDANIPLSLGVPAVTLGAGGNGGGIHTSNEWYDASGRELGLRRILLTLLAAAG